MILHLGEMYETVGCVGSEVRLGSRRAASRSAADAAVLLLCVPVYSS
jgi:hypothetical protein